MTTKTCIKCGEELELDAFGNDSRTPDGKAKTCTTCKQANGAGKRKGTAKKAKAKGNGKAKPAAPEPIRLEGAIEVPSGMGFRASIENGTLQLEQDRPSDDGETYTHSLCLARHEASKLIEWIAALIEPEGVAA